MKADCKVEEIDSFYTVLKRMEMLTVNVEELNYLAKRLESFDDGEAAQFQAMAHKLELSKLKDFIASTRMGRTVPSMSLKHPSTCCPTSRSIRQVGWNTAMWPAAVRLSSRCWSACGRIQS